MPKRRCSRPLNEFHEVSEPVVQDAPIFDRTVRDPLIDIINQLDPASFLKLARSCKEMHYICFFTRGIQLNLGAPRPDDPPLNEFLKELRIEFDFDETAPDGVRFVLKAGYSCPFSEELLEKAMKMPFRYVIQCAYCWTEEEVKMTTLKEEEPYAAVVKDGYIDTTCAKCFCKKKDSPGGGCCTLCKKFYYCSKECQTADWKDHAAECADLREYKRAFPSEHTRLLARIFRRMKREPDFTAFNNRTFDSLEQRVPEHEEKCEFECRVNETSAEIEKFMRTWAPDYDSVFKAMAKCESNRVDIRDGTKEFKARGTGIYLGLSVLKHSCRPDAILITKGSKLFLKTTNENFIRYRNSLTICYTSDCFFGNTEDRRRRLLAGYNIDCKCKECEDSAAEFERTSGRPECCPAGIFTLNNPRCSLCDGKISEDRISQVTSWNRRLHEELLAWEKFAKLKQKRDVYALMEIHKQSESFLSDENTHFIGLADLIYRTLMFDDLPNAIKFVDICLPHARKRPDSLYSVMLFCRRFELYERANRSFDDVSRALVEAYVVMKTIYVNHELTRDLHAKMEALNDRLSQSDSPFWRMAARMMMSRPLPDYDT